jgi:hypothetical protein
MKTWVSLVAAMLFLITGLVATAPAEVVGRITQVEGRVDLLKGGQLPATPVKLEDPVGLGDVLRTKSLSKANITFVDNTVITISPESRIAIEEYMFDPAKGKRNAVLQLFHGMALAVVSKIYKAEQPDFVIKTHTAIMGVRGTEVGVRLSANDSTFLNFQGLTRVASVFPEISGDLFRKAAKVALSFDKGYVDLGNMQATTVARGLPPTLPYGISSEDRQMFMRQMVVSTLGTSSGVCSPTASTSCASNSVASSSSVETASNAAFPSGTNGLLTGGVVIIQPVPAPVTAPPPPAPAPTLTNLSFSQILSSIPGSMTASGANATTATFNINSVSFSGSFATGPQSFLLANSGFTATTTSNTANSSIYWNNVNNVQVTYTPFNITGTLSGPTSGTLSGTMNMTLTIPGAQTFTLQGPVTYANGVLTFNNLSGTFTSVGGLPSGNVSSGTWTALATSPAATTTAAATVGSQLMNARLAGTRTGAQGLHLRR